MNFGEIPNYYGPCFHCLDTIEQGLDGLSNDMLNSEDDETKMRYVSLRNLIVSWRYKLNEQLVEDFRALQDFVVREHTKSSH